LAIITCITLQTILTLLSLLIPGFPSWIVIAASIALLGVAVICILTVDGGIRRADYLDQKVEAQTQFISTIKTELQILVDNVSLTIRVSKRITPKFRTVNPGGASFLPI